MLGFAENGLGNAELLALISAWEKTDLHLASPHCQYAIDLRCPIRANPKRSTLAVQSHVDLQQVKR